MSTPLTAADEKRVWPSSDFTGTPYWVFTDPPLFEREMEQIFRGPTWNYLALECEIPNAGDFVTCYVGTTPVVVSRKQDGAVTAFVNRCQHRGMQVVRELRGNQTAHVCPYHQWCYDESGKLTGVPLQRGEKGVPGSGMPKDFSKDERGMRTLRVSTLRGVVFGTLDVEAPPLDDYLGAAVLQRLGSMLTRPLRVSGYQRHTLKTNWKLFAENSRDAYHAPMLHPFLSTFGLINPNDHGTSQVSHQGFHSVISIYNDAEGAKTQRGKAIPKGRVTLQDMSLMHGFKEHDDGLSLNIVSIFPSTLFTCVGNTWSVRQIRPKSPGVVELLYTHFGFDDDTPEQLAMRRKQGNLVGPAGYVSIEDVEALELLQAAIAKGEDRTHSTIQMGGRDVADQPHVMTEVAVRGLWKGYCDMMGFKPAAQAA